MWTEEIAVSVVDGQSVAYTLSIPDAPRFCVQICHGMAEHRRRYYPFMEYVASLGGACVIHDMRGHGDTSGAADYGVFHGNGEETVLADVSQIGDILRERCPDLPFILMGHSMGTLGARAWTAFHDDRIDGLLLTGEVSKNPAAGLGLFLSRVTRFFRGERAYLKLLEKSSIEAYNKKIPPEEGPGSAILWLSVDKENRIAYEQDPACGFSFTVSGYETLFRLLKDTYRPKNWEVRNREMPVLFLSGADDPVLLDEKHFNDAVCFLRDMGYRNVASKLYPGLRHEILNETERAAVWRDCAGFFLSAAGLPPLTENP